MKKFFLILSIVLMLALVVGCGEEPAPTPSQNTDTGSVENGGSQDVDTESSLETDSSIDTGSSTNTSSSEDTESSVDTVPSGDVQSSQSPQPPADDKPSKPVVTDGPIDIAAGGISDYVVVYEAGDQSVEEFTLKLLNYLEGTHGISLEAVADDVGTDSEHCIYIGDVSGILKVKARMNKANDFGACVMGDDYVLYATTGRLYNYFYELLTTEILTSIKDGNWSTQPNKDFIYHNSRHRNVSYVDYVLNKKGGVLTQDILVKDFFDARTFVSSDGAELKYRIYVPYDYDSRLDYPVLTILHGAGERGSDNEKQMTHMLLNMFKAENSPLWSSIVICPQCPDWPNQWVDTPWENGNYSVESVPESDENRAVMELLDLVQGTYSTDLNRYYLSGLSMGGFGTWDLLMRHSDRFAAAVPLCGGADYTQAYKLVNKPIYTIHGTNDRSVPISGTRLMVEALQNAGSTQIIYEELNGYGHNVWDYASTKAEIWTWLFGQSLENQ